MNLPRHNPLLKGLYLLAVIGMFTFMMFVIRAYWPDDTKMAKWHNSNTSHSSSIDTSGELPSTKAKVNAPTKNTAIQDDAPIDAAPLIQRAQKQIIGIPFTLDLTADSESQITSLWRKFYNDDQLHKQNQIKSKHKVYLVYLGHNSQSSTVDMLLGYTAKPNTLSNSYVTTTIPAGSYLKTTSVLDTWNSAKSLSVYLTYQQDYEVYTLDRNFDVLTQTAYVRTQPERR